LSQAQKLFQAMARNPRGDWRIADIEVVCKHFGLICKAPSGGGSHYSVSHPSTFGSLTIPARRPIKPFYIKAFVDYIRGPKGPANDA
jgi:hypothetical protein